MFDHFTFKILGQSTFTLTQFLFLYLEVLLFIIIFYSQALRSFSSLFLFLLLALLSILYTNFHWCNYLPIFELVTTYILTLY